MCVSKCVLYLNILFFIPSSKSQLLRFCSFSVPVNINFHTHKFCLQTAHGYRHSCYFHYYFISFGDYSLPFLAPCHLLSCRTFPLHLRELCILSYCCPGSLPFLLAGHPTYAFSSNQHLFSFKENHPVPGSSFDKSSFVVVVLSCAVSQHGFEETSLPKWLFFVPSPSQAMGARSYCSFYFFTTFSFFSLSICSYIFFLTVPMQFHYIKI